MVQDGFLIRKRAITGAIPPAAPAEDDGRRIFAPGALAIMAAAERLIGRHGIDGISTRQITIAAGMGNNSAVAYHFGDREGLLRAISEWRLPTFEASARRLYEQATHEGRLDDPAMLVRLILEPSMAIVDEDGRHLHAAFMREMLRSAEGRAIRTSLHGLSSYAARLVAHLIEICPGVPADLMRYRLRIGSVAFFDALVERDFGTADAEFPVLDDAGFMAEMVGMVTAICARPPSGR